MPTTDQLLAKARERSKQNGYPYDGAFLPSEAFELTRLQSGTVIVDVRTKAEWTYVGRIPGSVEIEWQSYPGGTPNPQFLAQLEGALPKHTPLLFICRSGARSHAAATAAKQAGFVQCYNVLEGFEGDLDSQGHRNTLGGWRACGLPWHQS